MNEEYSFDTFLQVIEFLNKNEREFEIDVNVLEMDGINTSDKRQEIYSSM